tara:strand:- start:8663 stop:9418 length:756 start_codon:yes stop_codon:yes gene_type:complete
MRLKLHCSLLALLLFSLLALPVWALETEQDYSVEPPLLLQWGFVHFPPLIYLDEEKKPKGDLAELMAAISLDSGIPYKAMLFPNIRAIFNLNQQQINFAIAAKSLVNNENNFLISRFPVAEIQLRTLWRTGTKPVHSIEDLMAKRLILLRGYTYGGIRAKVEQISENNFEVENHERALTALKFKRGDYAIVYKSASEYSMSMAAKTDFEYSIIGTVELFFILNAKVPYAEQIMQRLEAAFLRYQETLNVKN